MSYLMRSNMQFLEIYQNKNTHGFGQRTNRASKTNWNMMEHISASNLTQHLN